MQFLRSGTWRLLGLIFCALLACAIAAPDLLGGESADVPVSSVAWAAGACVLGLSIRPLFIQTTETLTHEVGHALLGALLGARVRRIAVRRDTSGATESQRGMGRLRSAIISAAGPLASPTFFVFTTLMLVKNLPHIWVLFVLVGVVLVTITTVRNFWGWIVGAVAVAILWQTIRLSLDVGSDPQTWHLPAIWPTSSANAAAILTAFNAGIALRYSWRCRQAPSSNMDEYKLGRALGIGPRLGGHLILLSNLGLVIIAFYMMVSNK